MPVIIAPEDFDRWLDVAHTEPRHVQDLLVPPPDDLFDAVPVSYRVNAVRNDDPGLHQPVEEPTKPTKEKKKEGGEKIDLF